MPPACEGILTYAPEQALANLPMPACAALSSNRTQASRVDKRVEPLMHVQGTPVSMPALTSAVLLPPIRALAGAQGLGTAPHRPLPK